MKILTFFCMTCRRQSPVEVVPALCLHCGSRNGLLRRWRNGAATGEKAFSARPAPPAPQAAR